MANDGPDNRTERQRQRFRADYEERMAVMTQPLLTQEIVTLRGEVIDGGEAESPEDLGNAVDVVPDRGTLRAPRVVSGHQDISGPDRLLFLESYAMTGLWNQSAYSVGRSGASFRRLSQEDPCFQVQVQEAIQDYRELLQAEVVRRGMRGVIEPVFGRGGKDAPDQLVGYVRRFSDKLLELEIKAAWPKRYRENIPSTDGRRFGVLVVPGPAASQEEWQKEALLALQKPTPRRKLTKPVD